MMLRIDELKYHYFQAVAEEQPGWSPTMRYWFRCRMLATLIAGRVLGTEWFETNLAAEDDERPKYFRTDLNDEDTFPRFNMRVIELGEMILNLQSTEQFTERIEEIRSATRGVETKISELMGGRFFKQLGVEFRYRPPKGQKQEDYDIDYVRTDGKPGRCEVKSKVQDAVLSANTISNTLKEAKSQLPKGETGIILLRIPEEWVPWKDGVVRLEQVANAVTGWFAKEKTKRVSSVVVFDSRTDVVDSLVLNNCYYKEFSNPYCEDRSGLPDLPLGEQGYVLKSRNWFSIPQLVQKWHRGV